MCVCVCVFQCQSTALLCASGSTQGGWMALSVVFFESRTAWADHIMCGMSTYLCSVREKVEVRVTVSVTVCVGLLCCVGWWWKEGRRWNPVPAHSLLFSKITKGAAKLNVPIRRTNRYQQYFMPFQHTYCGRVWNWIQDVMYNLAIRECTSPSLLAPRLNISY